jgi:hypothetical protein
VPQQQQQQGITRWPYAHMYVVRAASELHSARMRYRDWMLEYELPDLASLAKQLRDMNTAVRTTSSTLALTGCLTYDV